MLVGGENILKVTLDFNILIDFQNVTGQYKAIKKLFDLHNSKKICICIPAIAASEYRQTSLAKYSQFTQFIKSLGLSNYIQLMPIYQVGLTYIEYSIINGEELEILDETVHSILFPNIEFSYKDYCRRLKTPLDPIERKWQNARCDVQSIWSHIWHSADVYITMDKNFHKQTKKAKLEALGANRILQPKDFLLLLT